MDRKIVGSSHSMAIVRGLKTPRAERTAEFEAFLVAPEANHTVSGAVRIEVGQFGRVKITGYDLNANSAETEIITRGDYVYARALSWAQRSPLYDTPNPFVVLTKDKDGHYEPVSELDPDLLTDLWVVDNAIKGMLDEMQTESSRFFLTTVTQRFDGLIKRLVAQRDRHLGEGTPLVLLAGSGVKEESQPTAAIQEGQD